MQIDSETGTERSCEKSAAGGGSHEGKRIQIYLDAACRRTLVYHDVDAVILHRRIEILLYHWRETVNLVDEKHVVRLQGGKDSCQVARLIEHRA